MGKTNARRVKKDSRPTLSGRFRALIENEKKHDNKRVFPRTATYQFARLRVEANSEIDCAIRDISEGGLRIKLEEARPLPATMQITFVANGQTKLCRLAWQKSKHAGLEFLTGKKRDYKSLND
ncbi:MAG: PilZ domain-containing protein [Pseudomonadota bacterium]